MQSSLTHSHLFLVSSNVSFSTTSSRGVLNTYANFNVVSMKCIFFGQRLKSMPSKILILLNFVVNLRIDYAMFAILVRMLVFQKGCGGDMDSLWIVQVREIYLPYVRVTRNLVQNNPNRHLRILAQKRKPDCQKNSKIA